MKRKTDSKGEKRKLKGLHIKKKFFDLDSEDRRLQEKFDKRRNPSKK
jgi:hypothetical protein